MYLGHAALPVVNKIRNLNQEKTIILNIKEENEAITWTVTTNVTIKPIKLIIDTGSQVTLIAEDLIKQNVVIGPPEFYITGISGRECRVSTAGSVDAMYLCEQGTLSDNFNLIDRRYTGNYDGYLGMKFMLENAAWKMQPGKENNDHPPSD